MMSSYKIFRFKKIILVGALIVLSLLFLLFFMKIKHAGDLRSANVNAFVVCGSLERYHEKYNEYPVEETDNLIETLIDNDQKYFQNDYLSATKNFISKNNREINYVRIEDKGFRVGIVDSSFLGKRLEIICEPYSFMNSGETRRSCNCTESIY